MEGRHDSSPMQAFEKDVLEMTCEDVYDISYVIGRDLLKVNTGSREFSDLQFKIVRVLEMFETMVNKYNLSLEELRMELENMKRQAERVVAEGSSGNTQTDGPNQLVVDSKDPNRPRFTMQELKEVLQERNKLKAQLLVAQEELQLYKRSNRLAGGTYVTAVFLCYFIIQHAVGKLWITQRSTHFVKPFKRDTSEDILKIVSVSNESIDLQNIVLCVLQKKTCYVYG